jgi:hypothetical protein
LENGIYISLGENLSSENATNKRSRNAAGDNAARVSMSYNGHICGGPEGLLEIEAYAYDSKRMCTHKRAVRRYMAAGFDPPLPGHIFRRLKECWIFCDLGGIVR